MSEVTTTPDIGTAQTTVSTKSKTAPKRRWLIWLGVGVGILAAIIIGLVLTYTLLVDAQTKLPAQVAENFVEKMQAGNANGAYDMTSTMYRQFMGSDEFATKIVDLNKSVSSEAPKLVVRKMLTNLGITTVYVGFNIGQGASGDHAVVMMRKDGADWKVAGVQYKDGTLTVQEMTNEINNLAANTTY